MFSYLNGCSVLLVVYTLSLLITLSPVTTGRLRRVQAEDGNDARSRNAERRQEARRQANIRQQQQQQAEAEDEEHYGVADDNEFFSVPRKCDSCSRPPLNRTQLDNIHVRLLQKRILDGVGLNRAPHVSDRQRREFNQHRDFYLDQERLNSLERGEEQRLSLVDYRHDPPSPAPGNEIERRAHNAETGW